MNVSPMFARSIAGWSERDSRALLDELSSFATQERFTYFHAWEPHGHRCVGQLCARCISPQATPSDFDATCCERRCRVVSGYSLREWHQARADQRAPILAHKNDKEDPMDSETTALLRELKDRREIYRLRDPLLPRHRSIGSGAAAVGLSPRSHRRHGHLLRSGGGLRGPRLRAPRPYQEFTQHTSPITTARSRAMWPMSRATTCSAASTRQRLVQLLEWALPGPLRAARGPLGHRRAHLHRGGPRRNLGAGRERGQHRLRAGEPRPQRPLLSATPEGGSRPLHGLTSALRVPEAPGDPVVQAHERPPR